MIREVTRLDKDQKMREGCATRRITTGAKRLGGRRLTNQQQHMWLPDHAPLVVTSVSGKSRRAKVVAASSLTRLCEGIKNQAAAVSQASSSLSAQTSAYNNPYSTFGSEDHLQPHSILPASIVPCSHPSRSRSASIISKWSLPLLS